MSLANLMKKGSLRRFATATVATTATVRPDSLQSVASVATVSVATSQKYAANDPTATAKNPDRWCWPHSNAMSGEEIDTFTARLARFTDKGLTLTDGVAVAGKLVPRDREDDDRRLCLECTHLAGFGPWRCNQWRRAGLGQPGIPSDMERQLQRCDGFKQHQ